MTERIGREKKMITGSMAGDGQRHGVFSVDIDWALEALRLDWETPTRLASMA